MHTNSTTKALVLFLALTAIVIILASSLYAQSSPSVSIRLSPSHSVPMDTAIAGTVILNNLDVDSYSSVIFRAEITPYNRAERRCNGDDTGRDIEIAVDDSREVFTAKIFDACPSAYDSYGSYTLDVSISRMDTSHPDGRVELASTRTQFMMSRYLTAGVPTATPPESGALAWMDPDPRNLDMVVHGEWHQFHFRVDITKYLNDHLGVLGYGSTQPDIFITLGEQIPGISVEQACRERRDDDVIHWRRASNQALVIAACKPGAAIIELRHETEAGPPLYTYNFRTLSNEPTPTATETPTPTHTPTPTSTPIAASTATPTLTPTAINTPTTTHTPNPTAPPTITPTATLTPTATYSPSPNATPPRSDAPVTGELPTDDPKVNFRVSGYAHDWVDIAWAVPQNRAITKYVVQRYEHDGSGFVSSGSGDGSRFEGTTGGGDLHSLRNTHVQPDTLYQYVLSLKNDSGTTIIESSTAVRTLSSDATLSALTLSHIDFGTFDSEAISYTAEVAYEASETTVAPILNHSGATYVIKLDGAVDEDGDVTLEVGENVITVEVTAEDEETTLTYAVTITRGEISLLTGELPSDDPPVNFRITSYDEDEMSLAWEIPSNRGITGYVLERYDHNGTEFVSSDWSVSVTVAGGDDVTESSASLSADSRYRYDLALKSDAGTIIIEKSLEVRTHAAGVSALSADAALSALSLSGVELEPAFNSSAHRYTASVASDVAQTTVAATLNDSAASYVVKLGGAEDADGEIDLTPGRNVITVHVTAEDGVSTRIYTVVVTRARAAEALSTDATLRALSLSGIDFGTFDPDNTSYTADVTNDVTQTTVTPVRNDVEAVHVIKLDGVEDTDGVIDLAVVANVITVEVTAEDGVTTRAYTVTVTREDVPAPTPAPDPEPEPADTCVQPIGADGTITGSWDDTCLSEKNAPGGAGDRYARFYTFTLDEATDIVTNLTSDEDTYLYLLDGHGKGGNTLHSNDDIASGGVNLNSRLSVTLQPGSYTIEATTYSPATSGSFTLTIAGLSQAEVPAPPPQPDPEPEPEGDTCIQTILGDGTIEGSWDDTCLSDKAALSGTGDRYARFYTFTLDETADVTILLESDEDSYLYVLQGQGKDGESLHSNDDIVYRVNTNSRLSVNLDAGDYTIEATTYYAQRDGDFTLIIEGLVASP